VLTSNLGGTRLYLNEGSSGSADVTEQAGLHSKGWTTGVTLADVNGDGRLDIYVCHAGLEMAACGPTRLYINQGLNADGVPTFVEQAAAYGVADSGYSTQAVFFDYDRDGDLDLFVINNSPRPVESMPVKNTRNERDPLGGAKLYRNDGGHFTDVSAAAGIYGGEIGRGLGVGVSDVNEDGWPDIYVANDFFERDYLYINRVTGPSPSGSSSRCRISVCRPWPRYRDVKQRRLARYLRGGTCCRTTSIASRPPPRLRPGTASRPTCGTAFITSLPATCFHLNNGNGTFSDIGQMAGVARTDWSWSVLLADLDLDGFKDIYVTNGPRKDVTSQTTSRFSEPGDHGSGHERCRVDFRRLVDAMSSTKLPTTPSITAAT